MLTDEEIEAIAEDYVTNVGGYSECGGLAIEDGGDVRNFARAIEAKVRAEYEPKFKVGDTVRTIYNRDKDAIIAKVEVYGLSYEGDDCGSIYGYQEYEIEKIQEDEKC